MLVNKFHVSTFVLMPSEINYPSSRLDIMENMYFNGYLPIPI